MATKTKSKKQPSKQLLTPKIGRKTQLIGGFMVVAMLVGSFFVYHHFYSGGTAEAATIIPKVGVIYGDSITFESGSLMYGRFLANKTWKTSQVRAWPGTAVCDWLPKLQEDVANLNPNVIVMEFQGNSFTPCMQDANGNQLAYGSQAFFAKYRTDVDLFLSIATSKGARVVIANTLPTSTSTDQTLNGIYLAEAGKYRGVAVSNVPRNSVTASGKFVWTKKCLTSETTAKGCDANKQITVRNPDGLHLCPVAGHNALDGDCPKYSSGEFRFAQAMVSSTFNPPKPILP